MHTDHTDRAEEIRAVSASRWQARVSASCAAHRELPEDMRSVNRDGRLEKQVHLDCTHLVAHLYKEIGGHAWILEITGGRAGESMQNRVEAHSPLTVCFSLPSHSCCAWTLSSRLLLWQQSTSCCMETAPNSTSDHRATDSAWKQSKARSLCACGKYLCPCQRRLESRQRKSELAALNQIAGYGFLEGLA